MTARAVPRLAQWFVERLCGAPYSEPLVGDLAEQFAQGRSRGWYWRQAGGAIGVRLIGNLRRHGASFVAAVLAGCAVNWLLEQCCSIAFEPVYQNLPAVKLHPWSAQALFRLAGMLGNTAFWSVICITCAWLVTRVHRAHQRAVLLTFVGAQIAQRLPDIRQLVMEAAKDPSVTVLMVTQIILAGLNAAFMLVAGLWAIRTRQRALPSRWIRLVALLWIGQVFLTSLLFAARRVGELSYAQPVGYLSLYAIGVVGGLYLAVLLWRTDPPTAAPIRLA